MAGRPSKITPDVLSFARELIREFPSRRDRNRRLLDKYPMGECTRKKVFRMAAASMPDESREAPVRPEGPPRCDQPVGDSTGPAPPLTDPEQIREANMAMYQEIRDNPRGWPKDRLAAGSRIDRLHDNFPQDAKDAMTPEQECKQIQEKIDKMFGLGYTVTTEERT